MTRRRVPAIAVTLRVLVVAVAALLDRALSRFEQLDRHRQPATITYADGGTHDTGIVRERSLLLGGVKRYSLYTGRSPDFTYGHVVRLSWSGGDRPVLREAIRERDGVRARFTSGHEIFVPSRYFMFGR